MNQPIKIRIFDQPQSYLAIFEEMKTFTQQRDENTIDELWLLEHLPVFTQGLAGKAEHILNPHEIAVVQSDRGGQVTYHGPGQLIAYALLDLRRKALSIRELVSQLELTVIELLSHYDIKAYAKRDAPGVYIEQAKICSLGLRVKRGCSYHGLALNFNMDLKPFSDINPCGYAGLTVTQMTHFDVKLEFEELKKQFVKTFCQQFNYHRL